MTTSRFPKPTQQSLRNLSSIQTGPQSHSSEPSPQTAAAVIMYLKENKALLQGKRYRDVYRKALEVVRGTDWDNADVAALDDYQDREFLRRTYRALDSSAENIETNLSMIKAGAWRENEDARRIAEIHGELQYANAEERMELLKELHACHRRFAEARKINLSDGDVIDRQTKTVVNGGVTDGEKETK